MTLDIRVTEKITKLMAVEPEDVGRTVMQYVDQLLHSIDDGGLDWYTYAEDTYIGGANWPVSADPQIATLVDAANILRYGNPFHISEDEIKSQLDHEADLGL